jgi:hypothetical protein
VAKGRTIVDQVAIRGGREIFLCFEVFVPAVGPKQHFILWVTAALSLALKPLGRKADYSNDLLPRL